MDLRQSRSDVPEEVREFLERGPFTTGYDDSDCGYILDDYGLEIVVEVFTAEAKEITAALNWAASMLKEK